MDGQTSKFKTAVTALAIAIALSVVVFVGIGIWLVEIFKGLHEWGDFFGGTLGPILSSVTILALLYTIVLQREANDLQRKELALSRNEAKRAANALENQIQTLERQNFEATFFKMLEMHNDNISKFEAHFAGVKHMGRACFPQLVGSLRRIFSESDKKSSDSESKINLANNKFWREHSWAVGHYYRLLYNLIKFVGAYEGDKRFYMNIVRAQLSNHELALLFYNCLSGHGEKMKPLVEKYALLKHLPDDLLLDPSHKSLIAPSAFGDREQNP